MTWTTRRPEPDPALAEPIRSMPRMGGGVCWSLVVAQMAEEEAERQPAPNPWSPDPEEAA